MLKGRVTVRYQDRDEVVEAGDAFYMPPRQVIGGSGHRTVGYSMRSPIASRPALAQEREARSQGAH